MNRPDTDSFPLVIYNLDSGNDTFFHHSYVIPSLSSKSRHQRVFLDLYHDMPHLIISSEYRTVLSLSWKLVPSLWLLMKLPFLEPLSLRNIFPRDPRISAWDLERTWNVPHGIMASLGAQDIFTLQSKTALLAAAFCWAEALETVSLPDLGSTSRDLSEKAKEPSTGVKRSFMASLAEDHQRRIICAMLAALSLTAPAEIYTTILRRTNCYPCLTITQRHRGERKVCGQCQRSSDLATASPVM